MTGIALSLIFAGLAASSAWQTGKRGWAYLKMGRDFMQVSSTEATGRSLLLAGILWSIGTLVLAGITVILLGFAVFYATLL